MFFGASSSLSEAFHHRPLIPLSFGTSHITSLCLSFLYLQGTVNNQTGIFPESFVKIIKPLPESDSDGEGGGFTYSCLRCFLLTPSGVETRSVDEHRDLCGFMFTLYVMGDISNMLVMRPIPSVCTHTHKSFLIPQYQWQRYNVSYVGELAVLILPMLTVMHRKVTHCL